MLSIRVRHCFAVLVTIASSPGGTAPPMLPVVGAVEKVMIGNPRVEFEAKIDSGADISSIDATDITRTGRGRETLISFVVPGIDGKRIRMSAPLVRHAYIKRGGNASSRRPVVLLDVCLGPLSRKIEVSLVDRGGLEYDVLIGKNLLSGNFLIDPAKVHALPPACPAERGT